MIEVQSDWERQADQDTVNYLDGVQVECEL